MNKQELKDAVAKKLEWSKADAGKAVDATIEAMTEELQKKTGEISLVGFGSFKHVKRKARVGTNPRTKEKIKIPASVKVRFKPSSALENKK